MYVHVSFFHLRMHKQILEHIGKTALQYMDRYLSNFINSESILCI